MLLDDSLRFHEVLGATISNHLFENNGLSSSLRGQDFGELLITAFIGAIFSLLFIKYFYTSNLSTKNVSFNLLALVILLLFFGVVIDMAQIVFPNMRGMTTLEDGGEMVAMSLTCWYTYNISKHGPATVFSILSQPLLKLSNKIATTVNKLTFHIFNLY